MTDQSIDRTRLPIRRPPFSGVVNRTLDGSEPDWDHVAAVRPPEGAPNVLLVLIDDAGFGNPSTFGGPIDTPNYTRMARGRASLQPLPRDGALLADAGRAAHRPQPPPRRASAWSASSRAASPATTAIVPRSCAPFPRVLQENGYTHRARSASGT